jgi:hypothetical protein
MILGMEIAMLVMAIVALVRGKMTLSRSRVLQGTAARLIGAIGLLPLPLAFAAGFGFGVYFGMQGQNINDPANRWILSAMEAAITVLCFVLMMALGYAFATPSEADRSRDLPDTPAEEEPIAVAPVTAEEQTGVTTPARELPPPRRRQADIEAPATGRGSGSGRALPWILGAVGAALLLMLLCGVGGVGLYFFLRDDGQRGPNKLIAVNHGKPFQPPKQVENGKPDLPLPPDLKIEPKNNVQPIPFPPDNKIEPKKNVQRTPLELAAAPVSPGPERVFNGDFELGQMGFVSKYRHSAKNIQDVVTYDIVTNPQAAHGGAAQFGDHTSGKGKMMAVNGGNAPDQAIWAQKVKVAAGAKYTFSMWVASWYPLFPAELEVCINGKSIGRVTAPGVCGQWQELQVNWDSQTEEFATIEIFDLNTAFSGNDFAIDDISLKGAEPKQ